MSKLISRLKRHSLGAALVEYCVLIGLVAVAVILAVFLLGNQVREIFLTVDDTLASNITAAEVAELVDEAAGADPIMFDYTNPASYPDDDDCFPGGPGDWYDPTYTCFLVDAQPYVYYDYSSDTSDPIIVKMTGPTGPEDETEGMTQNFGVGVDIGSGSIIVDVDGPQNIYAGGWDDVEIAFPNRTCSSAEILYGDFGPTFSFPDGLVVSSASEVDRVWCGGDDVVLEGDDLTADEEDTTPPSGGDDGDPIGPSSEWYVMDGCVQNSSTGELWCKGSPPWEPLPDNLAWAQYEVNGDYCVFDKDTFSTVDDFTGEPGVCVTQAYAYQINSSDEILRFYPY